jgi:hypothetical protein
MFLSIHFMRSYGTILPSIILMDLSEMSECMCSSSVFCLREFFISCFVYTMEACAHLSNQKVQRPVLLLHCFLKKIENCSKI